jgi:hypothetical protein
MADVRSEETKKAFIKYLEEHPEERFWQAVRNFSGKGYVWVSNRIVDDPNAKDTFYWEAKTR